MAARHNSHLQTQLILYSRTRVSDRTLLFLRCVLLKLCIVRYVLLLLCRHMRPNTYVGTRALGHHRPCYSALGQGTGMRSTSLRRAARSQQRHSETVNDSLYLVTACGPGYSALGQGTGMRSTSLRRAARSQQRHSETVNDSLYLVTACGPGYSALG